MDKPKGAARIICERGFTDLEGKLSDGRKVSMNGTSPKDPVINIQLLLTPKYHPKISGRGVEYARDYSKLRF